MDWRTAILWGLGAAQLTVAWFACTSVESVGNEWLMFTLVAVLYAQPYLAGIWISFGGHSLPWRVLVVAVCLMGLTWADSSLPEDLVPVMGPGIVVALALMLLLQAFGWRLRDTTIERQETKARKYQFSLRSLLKWTTVLAVLFSLAGLANPAAFDEVDGQLVQMMIVLSVFHTFLAGIAVAEFAILFGMRHPLVGLVGIVSAALLVVGLFGRSTGQALHFALGICCLVGWLALNIVPLRLLGYRFERCHPVTPESSGSDARADCPFHVPPDLAD